MYDKDTIPTAFHVQLFLLNLQQLKSQTLVHGTIKDANGKLLQFANVLLLKSTDSSLVKGIISDPSGKYSFENIKNGNTLLRQLLQEWARYLHKYLKLMQIRKN